MENTVHYFQRTGGYAIFVNGMLEDSRCDDVFGFLENVRQPFNVDRSLNSIVYERDLDALDELSTGKLSDLVKIVKERYAEDLKKFDIEISELEKSNKKARERLVNETNETLSKMKEMEKSGKILVTRCSLGSWNLFYLNDKAMYRKTTEDELLDALSGESFEINKIRFDLGGAFENNEYVSLTSALEMNLDSFDEWAKDTLSALVEKIEIRKNDRLTNLKVLESYLK